MTLAESFWGLSNGFRCLVQGRAGRWRQEAGPGQPSSQPPSSAQGPAACFLTDCPTLSHPYCKMTRASPSAFRYDAEFRAGQGSRRDLPGSPDVPPPGQECVTSRTQQVHLCSWSVAPGLAQTGPHPEFLEKGQSRRERVVPRREVSWRSIQPIFLPQG